MWQPETYPLSLREAVAMHSLLFTLGYSLRDEVFIIFNPTSVLVQLRAEGHEVAFRMGSPEHTPEVMREKWLAIMKEWNTGGSATQADKDALCHASKSWHSIAVVYAALRAHGFKREPREDDPMFSKN